jgi:hypothetical protein
MSFPERIACGDADVLYSGFYDCICAGRCFPVVIAWFERDIHVGTSGIVSLFAGISQRLHLCMGLTKFAVVSFANNTVIFDQNSPHHWVWLYPSLSPTGQMKRAFHIFFF